MWNVFIMNWNFCCCCHRWIFYWKSNWISLSLEKWGSELQNMWLQLIWSNFEWSKNRKSAQWQLLTVRELRHVFHHEFHLYSLNSNAFKKAMITSYTFYVCYEYHNLMKTSEWYTGSPVYCVCLRVHCYFEIAYHHFQLVQNVTVKLTEWTHVVCNVMIRFRLHWRRFIAFIACTLLTVHCTRISIKVKHQVSNF